jgi:hypothetical protein
MPMHRPSVLLTSCTTAKMGKMNQHYVPKFLIEGFVNEDELGNRGVWVYRASDCDWSKRPTRQTAALDDFYTFVENDEPRDDTLEESMGRIEKLFAPILRDAISTRREIAPPQPFDAIVTFCSLLICRNPTTAARTGDILVRKAKQIMSEVIATEESFQQFRKEFIEKAGVDFPNIVAEDRPRLLTDFRVSPTRLGSLGISMLTLQFLPEQLATMAISFYHTSLALPFITADVPYAIKPATSDSDSFEIEQLIVPLSPSVTAVFDAEEPPLYRHRDASEANVRQVNAAILCSAREFLLSRDPNVIPIDVLRRWSEASPDERVLIAGGLVRT